MLSLGLNEKGGLLLGRIYNFCLIFNCRDLFTGG